MIDTHIHLDYESYDSDREAVIDRFFEAGGKALINIGDDVKTSRNSLVLAGQNEKIYASVGIHPYGFNQEECDKNNEEDLAVIRQLARTEKVVAIGEIGLDYYNHVGQSTTPEQKESQKQGFQAQLDIAAELDLPVVIHCRDAYEDVYAILTQKGKAKTQNFNSELSIKRGVFHCYGGGLDFTRILMRHDNIFFSFTGNITFAKPGAEIIEVIRLIPLERIMVETDGPFLTPVPYRGKRNEPLYVKYVIERLAEIKSLSIEEVERTTDQNSNQFFFL